MTKQIYTDLTTSKEFPKTLIIRNTPGGMIWQIYHPDTQEDVDNLTSNAYSNGFFGITLEDYNSELKETWEDWRETKIW